MRSFLYIFFLSFSIIFIDISLSFAYSESGSCADWTRGSDTMGRREVCKGGFPTTNERMKIARVNTDAFSPVYKIYHQWCWFQFFGECVLWDTNIRSATFHESDFYNRLSENFGLSSNARQLFCHTVAVYSYAPGAGYQHSGRNDTNRTKICGYYCMSDVGGTCSPTFNWDYSLIGCVDGPIYPGPPTFNDTIAPGMEPMVDDTIGLEDSLDVNGNRVQGYISLGSKFDQPVIRLNEITGAGSIERTLLLRYKFPGDTTNYDNLKTCNQIPGSENKISYCAQVPSDNPSQVCVCQENSCANEVYLGCVPRPTPRQSNYGIVSEYTTTNGTVSGKSTQNPALKYYFVKLTNSGEIIYIDADGSAAAYGSDKIAYKLDAAGSLSATPANGTLNYATLALSPTFGNQEKDSLPLKEYYENILTASNGQTTTILAQDVSAKIYGVQFAAFIPQFNANGTYRKVKIITPAIRASTDGCGAYSVIVGEDGYTGSDMYPSYTVPSGKRIRNLCCAGGAGSSNCLVPPITACKNPKGAMPEPDYTAEFSVCPGIYNGAVDVNKPDKMCLVESDSLVGKSDWDFINAKDQVCVDIITP
ncbi:hypothetical protein I862_02310 [endosymbiont of Acanthamoeba sp. UWC8]|uniref:hypothetical protein n=1 Tax=endosymbiont of Acanthamoeba sp. UWC8 TaxID=86106 RepID=UPI0004D17515|nr:hypothetical protein [endosymbiont of Acanthamoeba sp. UWC8]AIF81025.1 hypothetical protein I862_02310 [endosymbiont of Acanthamoeba sp. UWC8]